MSKVLVQVTRRFTGGLLKGIEIPITYYEVGRAGPQPGDIRRVPRPCAGSSPYVDVVRVVTPQPD